MKVLCLVIVNVNVTKYMPQKCQIWQICGYQVCFFQALNTPKFVFSSAPDPTGGAYDAPPGLLVGWGGGDPLPIPFPLDASVVGPPNTNSWLCLCPPAPTARNSWITQTLLSWTRTFSTLVHQTCTDTAYQQQMHCLAACTRPSFMAMQVMMSNIQLLLLQDILFNLSQVT